MPTPDQTTRLSEHTSGSSRPLRRSLRLQILSIAAIGTLGIFVFLAVMLAASKERADLLKEIRDVRYPVQESLLAALNNLEFIDSNIDQSIFSSNHSLLEHSDILAGQFRAHLRKTMVLEHSQAADVGELLTQFDLYYRDSHALALAVINGEKSLTSITPEKKDNAHAFNSLVRVLGNLQKEHSNSLVTSVDSATLRASNSLQVGLTTGLMTAALLFLIALITTRSILQRINNMVSSLRNIATGTGDMNVRIPLTGSDEMTELAYWFNTFIERLQRLTTESTAEIKRLAFTDTLTNLPNRRMFLRCLEMEIERIQARPGKTIAVMFLDLDNFKPVNDQFGHDAGDELIRIVAKRLLETVRSTDTVISNLETIEAAEHEPGQAVVARLAGDEFMMIISDIENPQQVESVADRIRQSVMQPVNMRGMECSVGVSIGICLYPDNASDADELVTCADMAMYEAKNSGKNTYRFFDPELRTNTDRKIKIDNAIKKAIPNGELHLLFQPKYRLSDQQLIGAEALLRWKNEELGTFAPADFIAQAEASGKICDIDDWVLSAVVDQLALWEQKGFNPLEVALNFSANQASRPNLAAAVERLAGDKTYLMNRIEIEITETSAIENIAAVESNIQDLKKLGIKIAMDDFGAGHSSLTLLTRCHIDTLKIDKEATRNIQSDRKSQIVVQSIIDLATQLEVAVVAEGLEDEAQVQALAAMNCDYGQGYYLSKPLSADQFTLFLQDHQNGLNKAA